MVESPTNMMEQYHASSLGNDYPAHVRWRNAPFLTVPEDSLFAIIRKGAAIAEEDRSRRLTSFTTSPSGYGTMSTNEVDRDIRDKSLSIDVAVDGFTNGDWCLFGLTLSASQSEPHGWTAPEAYLRETLERYGGTERANLSIQKPDCSISLSVNVGSHYLPERLSASDARDAMALADILGVPYEHAEIGLRFPEQTDRKPVTIDQQVAAYYDAVTRGWSTRLMSFGTASGYVSIGEYHDDTGSRKALSIDIVPPRAFPIPKTRFGAYLQYASWRARMAFGKQFPEPKGLTREEVDSAQRYMQAHFKIPFGGVQWQVDTHRLEKLPEELEAATFSTVLESA